VNNAQVVLRGGLADLGSLPDAYPWPAYLLTGLALVVFHVAIRVDTDSTSTYRRPLTAALFVLSAALLLIGLLMAIFPPAP
jgi:hypothetical protein